MFPLAAELRAIREALRERVRELERSTGQIIAVSIHPMGRASKLALRLGESMAPCWR
jgi:hypothetical protein